MRSESIVKFFLSAVLSVASLSAAVPQAAAQNRIEGIVSFDKLTHDFGDIMLSDGPQDCEFTLENISSAPIVIYRVTTSCGCTEPTWTEAPIRPGEKGKISVTFSNDQGPYPFNKSLTVYISELDRPVTLKVRGVVHEKAKSLEELFPVACGPIGFRESEIFMGQIDQGLAKSMEVEIANTSRSEVTFSIEDVSAGLQVSAASYTLPAKSKGRLTFLIDTRKTQGQKWGRTPFTFTLTVNGRKYPARISVTALIKENFSAMDENQRRVGALPRFKESTVNVGTVQEGTPVEATFQVRNIGKAEFLIYKADCDGKGVDVKLPPGLQGGQEGTLSVKADTKGLKGEQMNVLTLITNSPTRPIINLFLMYTVK